MILALQVLGCFVLSFLAVWLFRDREDLRQQYVSSSWSFCYGAAVSYFTLALQGEPPGDFRTFMTLSGAVVLAFYALFRIALALFRKLPKIRVTISFSHVADQPTKKPVTSKQTIGFRPGEVTNAKEAQEGR